MSYITTHFSGTVHGDVRCNTTASDVPVVNFRIQHCRRTRSGEDVLEEARLAAFGTHADLARTLVPGDRVHGRGEQRTGGSGPEIVVDKLEKA